MKEGGKKTKQWRLKTRTESEIETVGGDVVNVGKKKKKTKE